MYICDGFIRNQYNMSNAIQQGFVEPNIQQVSSTWNQVQISSLTRGQGHLTIEIKIPYI